VRRFFHAPKVAIGHSVAGGVASSVYALNDLGGVASDRRKLQLVVASRSAEYGRRLCHLRGSKKEADPITIH
jgi:hypothetical protein